ncbi:aminotransferase-like domain-containing protein [Enterococcus sp. LJL99]
MDKYLKISKDLVQDISSGYYQTGDKLPSINKLAQNYHCSRGTVIRAYRHLIDQQLVYVKNKSGYYSSFTPEVQIKADGYHLESGNPTMGSFHLPYAKQSLSLALDKYQLESLDVGANGVSSVIRELTLALSDSSIYTKEKNLFLTMGIQQTINVLCKMTFPNNRETILIEEPTYKFIIELFKAQSNQSVCTISRTKDGFDLVELEEIFKHNQIKFFYLVPRNHNPLGTTLPMNQRKKIVELAQKYDVYIAEDDYFLDAYDIPKYTPLYYLSSGEHCIYLGSLTKILPYLRIGFTIMPPELQSAYQQTVDDIMRIHYYTPPLISQSMLGVLIHNKFFEKSKQMINQDLKRKIRFTKKITASWDPNLAIYTGYDGYYASIQLNPKVPVDTLIHALNLQQIFTVSNRQNFFITQNFDNSLRVSLAKITVDQVIEVYPKIYTTIEKLYAKNT